MPKTVVAGDLVRGQMRLRLRVRLSVAGLPKTLFASATQPLVFWAENKGKQDA